MKKIFNLLVFTYLMLFLVNTEAQDRKGNIVQYFGKEKVEDINEGDVIHVFTDGLSIGGSGSPFGNSTISTNKLFAKYLQNDSEEIFEGKVEYQDMRDKDVSWENITVNEKNEFSDRNLRGSGYLYLTYDSPNEVTVLFEASGHSDILINGMPHEGDHYDYGWSLVPIKLIKGKNTFLLSGGRFPQMRARLLSPHNLVQFTTRDMTLPDLIFEEDNPL
ncbi:MAG: alpha/beta hydrolase, partial [Ignavibacteriae bacterium]|nr:alpha/beta hydrolase [Ignavibacteriota bacterium]